MNESPTVRRTAFAVVAGYAGATGAASLAILLWTGDFETIGMGLLVPLLVAPALFGFTLTSAWARFRRWRRAVYLALAVPMPLYLLWVVLFPSEGARTDAADEWALAFLIPTVVAAIVGWAILELWQRTDGGSAGTR